MRTETALMRAMGIPRYGALASMSLIHIPVPIPGAGRVRVRVQASAVNPADFKVGEGALKLLHARNFPMVLGYDFSGIVDAVGPGVEGFREGDEVFGFLPFGPFTRQGAFGERLVARVSQIALKPKAISHLQAAASATAGLTALQAIRDRGRLPSKDARVLVTGVSGGVGSLGVAIARRLGGRVTAVGAGRGLDLASRLGADEVVDRKAPGAVASVKGPFDVVFDATGLSRGRIWKAKIRSGGAFVTTLPTKALVLDKLASLASGPRVEYVMVKSRSADLRLVADWLAEGMEVFIADTVPVREVSTALERLKRGEVLGRLAIAVADGF